MRSSTERTLYNRQKAPGNHLERTCHISYAARDPICSVTTRNLKANLQTGQQAKEPSIAPDPFTRASPEDSNPQLGLWLCPSPSRDQTASTRRPMNRHCPRGTHLRDHQNSTKRLPILETPEMFLNAWSHSAKFRPSITSPSCSRTTSPPHTLQALNKFRPGPRDSGIRSTFRILLAHDHRSAKSEADGARC